MPETKTQHWQRRGRELSKLRKVELCALYRKLGGLGGIHPPEKWRKDEVVSSIVDIEWGRLPEDRKLPDPPRMTPPCDTCGMGENATAHRYGGDHHYAYTHDPDKPWVPESEAEAGRLAALAALAEEQPPEAGATATRDSGGLLTMPPYTPPRPAVRTEHELADRIFGAGTGDVLASRAAGGPTRPSGGIPPRPVDGPDHTAHATPEEPTA